MYSLFVLYLFAFLLGTVIGSFLNVCIYRIPAKKSVVFPPSSCPVCGAKIRFYDNIPIISYIILSGKCRSCGHHISYQYPIVELITGILSLFLFVKFGMDYQYLLYLLFVSSLIAISF
ncbi:MAG: prepilin peptidase, partial [Deltaproteobacteria bacterium]|nr:prepilin peptidase [Deltaproteobacteria bacterium]